jgi:hypothetical protein
MTNDDAREMMLLAMATVEGLDRADHDVANRLLVMRRKGVQMRTLAVTACNVGLTPAQERKVSKLSAELIEMGDDLGWKVEFSGDPRGWVVRLMRGESHDEIGFMLI